MKFDELLDKHLESLEDFVTAVEATRFRDWMAAHHPDVLASWVADHEVDLIADAINRRDRSGRARTRRRAGAHAFAAAVEQASAGDHEGLSTFAVSYVVDPEHTRKAVGAMTGADHRFVASGYEATGKRAMTLAAFHRAVAKKVGTRTTAEVMSEETYEQMLASILGKAA